MTNLKPPLSTIDSCTIARKVKRSTVWILILLLLSLAVLLRMQYVLLFRQQTEAAVRQAATLLAASIDADNPTAIAPTAATAELDGVLLLLPEKAGVGFQVSTCLAGGTAYEASLTRQALLNGEGVSQLHTDWGFGFRTSVEVACYQPLPPQNGIVGVLYAHRQTEMPLFSHTPFHTLSFVLILLTLCLLMLLYSRKLYHILVTPLEQLKAKACELTRNNETFEFMEQAGDEIDLIRNAFVLLRDRQQRLDESLDYAKEIQSRILGRQQDFEETFRDCGVYYKPLALVSGDFYWIEQFERGTVLVMGDCTGHGIPGALMTMMVISILDSIVTEQNCQDTKNILWKLDRQLSSILNTGKREGETYIKHGLDLIVIFIDRQHKTIKLSSASTNLYIVKPLNSVEVVRGQRLFIGDGKLKDKNQVKSVYLKYSPKCYYFMATDGLFEQIGGIKHIPYGYSRFKSILFENAALGTQSAIDALLRDFGSYMHGEIQRDDITIIGFRL